MDRRSLFRSAAASGLVGIAGKTALGAEPPRPDGVPVTGPQGPLPPLPVLTDPGERRGDMLYRRLGRTGESVSAIGFGGSHFAKPGARPEATSVRLCHAGARSRHQLHGQRVGLQRRRQRAAHGHRPVAGQATASKRLPHDQGGRPHRGQSAQHAARDQSLRPPAAPTISTCGMFHEVLRYDDPDRVFAPSGAPSRPRSRPAQGRQGPPHRLHRPQGPGASTST